MPRFSAPTASALVAASVSAAFVLLTAPEAHAQTSSPAAAQKGKWAAKGTLLEACTCAPPCSCNFGEPPSPHSYCHAVFAYRLTQAAYDGVDLSGLVVAAADGPNGESAFFDSRATSAQQAALQKLGKLLLAQGGAANNATRFVPAVLVHEVKGNHLRLAIGQNGGFDADVIIGRDGKTPVVVENNTVWPMFRATKGVTSSLTYKDATAGSISAQHTNANYGAFSFNGNVAAGSVQVALAAGKKTGKGCCGNQ